ncbi:ribosome recycling factor [Wohlfahrtiimonas populi]|uniref:ribosome recycling factor n=1 Tax=Wohlfahrtiimonas populi TaxID=1940240 RepID=UPI00098D23FC|nr:ribosome recycling factor [Wohlfahrtiimonas populi]
MINEIKQDAEHRMKMSIESLKSALLKLRTGRAHTSLLDHIEVEFYGSPTPLSQAANISVIDARTLGITPWDKNMVGPIEKAILMSDLGLNPATTGTLIRIPLPPLTEERRRDMVKVVKGEGENAKVAIRNIRRDANQKLKDAELSEDEIRRGEDVIQKITDAMIAEVDTVLASKEKELMEI